MKKSVVAVALAVVSAVSASGMTVGAEPLSASSPNGRIVVTFALTEGVPAYSISFDAEPVIRPPRLGFRFESLPPLLGDLVITRSTKKDHDETWQQPWGETRLVRNRYQELLVSLKERTSLTRRYDIVFRVFDDGVGFRYRS